MTAKSGVTRRRLLCLFLCHGSGKKIHSSSRDAAGSRCCEDLGSVRLDESQVAHAVLLGVEHRAGKPRAEDLDGEEVGLGPRLGGMHDRVSLPRSDLDDERRLASPHGDGVDRRSRKDARGCGIPRRVEHVEPRELGPRALLAVRHATAAADERDRAIAEAAWFVGGVGHPSRLPTGEVRP